MRKYLFLSFIFLINLTLNAQFFNFSLKSNNRQLIDEAIESSIVDVNQYYILVDTTTNQKMGRNGENFFNKIAYPGILTEEGLIVASSFLLPWQEDQEFTKYKGKYRPEISKTEFKINDESIVLDDSIIKPDTINDIIIIPVQNAKGISIDNSTGEKDGWIVWVSINKEGKRTLTSFSKQLKVADDRQPLPIEKPEELGNVEIGYCFTSKVTLPGIITFYLLGIIVKYEDMWNVIFPFKSIGEEISLTPLTDDNATNHQHKKDKKK